MQTKKELRKHILEQRLEMPDDEVLRLSEIICEKVKSTPEYREAKDVCLYMPANNEVDVTFLIDDAWEKGKTVWLPRTSGRRMDFYKFDRSTPLSEGSFKILEPESDIVLEPDENTLVLMPGVAFSPDGGRLGYGAGYYDIYLGQWGQCKTIAVCYGFQLVDELPIEEHDIKPDFIISENNAGKVEKNSV